VAHATSGKLIVDHVVPMADAKRLGSIIRDALPDVGFAITTEAEMAYETGFEKFLPPNVRRGRHVADALAVAGTRVRVWSVFHPTMPLAEMTAFVHDLVQPAYVAQTLGFPAAEVTEAGISKASGLQSLVDHLGLSAGDVWAFGDSRNDHEMLQWAGRGHAMANADDITRSFADVIVPHHLDDGVAQTLETLLRSL
jgi:hydroxymethylpyrimidine pyrophosphatase-like HAD family hydrolase